jgi:hypothetical protein
VRQLKNSMILRLLLVTFFASSSVNCKPADEKHAEKPFEMSKLCGEICQHFHIFFYVIA